MTKRNPGVYQRASDGEEAGASVVQPYEAKGMLPALTEHGADALRDVMTAVNGFYYPGDRSDAIYTAVAWLQAHPRACVALGLSERQ